MKYTDMTNEELIQEVSALQKKLEDTERIHQQNQDYQKKYIQLIQENLDGFALLDEGGKFVFCNDKYIEITGYSLEELQEETYKNLTPEEYHELDQSNLDKMFERGYSDLYEKEYIRRDGQRVPIEIRSYLIKDKNNTFSGTWSYVRDLTEKKLAESRLRDSKSWLLRSQKAGQIGIWSIDLLNDTIHLSEEAAKFHGLSEGQYTKDEVFGTVPPDDLLRLNRSFEEAIKMGNSFNVEHRIINLKSGEVTWIDSRGERVCDKDGNPIQLIGTALDITRSKQRETEIRLLNETLESAQQMAKVGYWRYDIATQIPMWSDQMFKVCGCHKEDGVPSYEEHKLTWHPDDWEMFDEAVQGCTQGKPYNIVVRIRFQDDTYHYVNTQGFPIYDNNGEIKELFGTSQDITELRLAEEELVTKERFISAIADISPAIIYVYDMESNCNVYVNSGIKRLLGFSPEEIQEKGENVLADLVHPDDLPEVSKIHSRISRASDEDILSLEYRMKNRAGIWKYLHSYERVFLRRDDGIVIQKIGVAFDITDQKKAQAERDEFQKKLMQAQKLESIGQLAGGIAHDFNNILYPIIGFTQLSQSELPKEHPIQENLTDILNGAKRARDLVKRILLFSRQKEAELEATTLQPVIQESYKLLRSTIPSNIDLLLDLYDGDDSVVCNSSEIHEIILNLCTNAYHAIVKAQGTIIISLKKENPIPALNVLPGEYLCLSVKDNGVGIPETLMDRIFDPYVTTKDIGKGSGLGLSIVHGLVKNYNGHINIESTSLKGTEIKIFLPCTTQLDPNKKIKEKDNNGLGNSEHILFVDDEESIVKLAVRALEKSGYRVTGINDSTEALKLFKSKPDEFDLVITDMAMPKIVGSVLAQQILEIKPNIPIIICSGYSENLDNMKAKGIKISACLDKPLTIENLLKNTRKILDSQKGIN